MTNLHKAYVEHLLNGYSPVKFGGGLVNFESQSGSGWFSDKAKSLWSGAKNIFNKHVRPVISSAINRHAPVLLQAGKTSLNDAIRKASNTQGSVRDRFNAGLSSVRNDLQTGKFNSADIIRKRDQPKSFESMMLPSNDIMTQTPAVYGSLPTTMTTLPVEGVSGYGLKRGRGRPRKIRS